jgi:hypothetical protein
MKNLSVCDNPSPWTLLAPVADRAVSADIGYHILAFVGTVIFANDGGCAYSDYDGQVSCFDLFDVKSANSILGYFFLPNKIIPMVVLLLKGNNYFFQGVFYLKVAIVWVFRQLKLSLLVKENIQRLLLYAFNLSEPLFRFLLKRSQQLPVQILVSPMSFL